eukprot:Sspe_Gene.91057::Locus_62531_Transcript_1_1_Confidence_1.000_Length_1379::g.91057::m.91057
MSDDSSVSTADTGCGEAVGIPDILHPLSVKAFVETYWGKAVYAGSVGDEVFERLKKGFGGGDLAEVLPHCRKDDNTTYTPEEMRGMETDYEESRKTLNLPLCFTEGADDLRESFIKECGDLGNDIEVGVYYSRPGGEAAPWHSDNNHNITIQVLGEKDWHCAPGSPHTINSRAMLSTPRNRYEQKCSLPDLSHSTVFALKPGSIIYLPPGHWHSVTAVGKEDSFSIDIRIGNILHSRWICEAIFASLLDEFHSNPSEERSVGPSDFGGAALSSSVAEQAKYVASNISNLLKCCRIPRCFPFERALTNGLHKKASLAYLLERGFAAPPLGAEWHLVLSPLVALTAKQQDACSLIVELRSESPLTTMEYARCALVAPLHVISHVEHLARTGRFTHSDLPSSPAKEDVEHLLRVLLHANVLYALHEMAPPSQPMRKRRKKMESI